MTKEEFISRQKALNRASNRWAIPVLVGFFGLLFANLPLAAFIERHKLPPWVHACYLFAFLGFLFASLLFAVWLAKRAQKLFGLHCPHCKHDLIGVSAQIALATRHCGYCGERVITDIPAA